MTTGTYSFGAIYGPEYVSRSWTGTDGKYMIVDGKAKEKWNDFEATESTQITSRTDHSGWINLQAWGGIKSYSPLDNIHLRSQSDLLSELRRHDFNLGVAVGEGKQVVRLVKDNLSRLGLAALNLKRGNFKQAAYELGVGGSLVNTKRGYANDLANRWLELQYGWKPLLTDVYEASKAFEVLTQPARKAVYKGEASDRIPWNCSAIPSSYSGLTMAKRKVYSWYELEEDLFADPRESLGLLDPKQVLWEMTPWSFVVDWFIPIGTYLENLHEIPKYLKGRSRTTVVIKAKAHMVPIHEYRKGATCYSTYRYIKRTCSHGLHSYMPRFKTFDQAMSPTHVWNAIALATSRFSVK